LTKGSNRQSTAEGSPVVPSPPLELPSPVVVLVSSPVEASAPVSDSPPVVPAVPVPVALAELVLASVPVGALGSPVPVGSSVDAPELELLLLLLLPCESPVASSPGAVQAVTARSVIGASQAAGRRIVARYLARLSSRNQKSHIIGPRDDRVHQASQVYRRSGEPGEPGGAS